MKYFDSITQYEHGDGRFDSKVKIIAKHYPRYTCHVMLLMCYPKVLQGPAIVRENRLSLKYYNYV